VPDAASTASNPAPPSALKSSAFKATCRWVLILGSLLGVGPLAAEFMSGVRDVDGGRAVTLFINGGAGSALVATLVLVGAVMVVGSLGARFFSVGTGYFCAGAVLAWAGSALGSLEAIVRRAGSGKDLLLLGVEGLIVTVGAAAAVVWFARLHGDQRVKGGWVERAVFAGPAPLKGRGPHPAGAFVGAVVAVGVAVWFIALSGERTQTLAATIAGGVAAGAVAHLLHAHRPLTPVLPTLAMGAVALLGPVVAQFVEGDRLVAHVYDGSVLSLARPVSLDWAAGALIGVPLGLSWAGASAEKRSG
jgi:hypothetical protein